MMMKKMMIMTMITWERDFMFAVERTDNSFKFT